MAYTNSSMVKATYLSPNCYAGRNSILGVIPHCYVGYASMASCGSWFGQSKANASCNYYIDASGNVALIVPESKGAWTTSNYTVDMTHVTIECASGANHPYSMTDATYNSLVKLTADIYKRNGIKECKWSESKAHDQEKGYIPMHRNYKNKACPGDWLVERYRNGDFCKRVNAILKVGEAPVDKVKQLKTKAVNDYGVRYMAHCQTLGWCDEVHDGQVAGTTGEALRLEAFKIALPSGVTASVKAHIQGIGWKTFENIDSDTVIGTTGLAKRLEAFEIFNVKGLPKGKKLHYSAHMQKIGWVSAEEDYPVGSMGQALRLEAVKFWVE